MYTHTDIHISTQTHTHIHTNTDLEDEPGLKFTGVCKQLQLTHIFLCFIEKEPYFRTYGEPYLF